MDFKNNLIGCKLQELASAIKSHEEKKIVEENRLKAEIENLKNQLAEKDRIIDQKCIENEELSTELDELLEENEDLSFRQKQMGIVYNDMKLDVEVRKRQLRRARISNDSLGRHANYIKMLSLSAEKNSAANEEKLKHQLLELSKKVETLEKYIDDCLMSKADCDSAELRDSFDVGDDRVGDNSVEIPGSADYKANFDDYSATGSDVQNCDSGYEELHLNGENGLDQKVDLGAPIILTKDSVKSDSCSDASDAKPTSAMKNDKRSSKASKKAKRYRKYFAYSLY